MSQGWQTWPDGWRSGRESEGSSERRAIRLGREAEEEQETRDCRDDDEESEAGGALEEE